MKLLKYLKLYLASKVNSDIIRSTTSSREFSNCISNLTGVNLVSLDGSLLRDVNHSLFEGIKRSGKEQDIIMREKWKENPSTYSRNIYGVVEPVINEALKKHKNLDARMRENTTYSVTLENPMGGHDQINITLFSSTDPVRESLRSGAFLHALTNNFPGMGMGISEEIFLKYISDFRASDGPGDHPLYTSLELLREESARLAKSKNQYSPYYALGANSVIENAGVVNTFNDKDVAEKYLMMFAQTTEAHVLQGNVPWTPCEVSVDKDFLAMVSVHKGEHPYSIGDKANIFLAPFIFYQTTKVAENYTNNFSKVQEKLGDLAYQYGHNGQVAAEFNQYLSSLTWFRHSFLGYSEVLAKPIAAMQMLGNYRIQFDAGELINATKSDESVDAAMDQVKDEISHNGEQIKEGFQPMLDSVSVPEKLDTLKGGNGGQNVPDGAKTAPENHPENGHSPATPEVSIPTDGNHPFTDRPYEPLKDPFPNDLAKDPFPKDPFNPVIDPGKKTQEGGRK